MATNSSQPRPLQTELPAGIARRNRPGNLVAVDPPERGGLGEILCLAIGGGDRPAASGTTGEAAVDPVAVGIIGDDEDAFFSRGRHVAVEGCCEGERGQYAPHGKTRCCCSIPVAENAAEALMVR